MTHSRFRRSGRFSWQVALVIVASLGAAIFLVVFLRIESWPGRTAAQGTAQLERLGKDLRSVFVDIVHFQPRITINNRVYLEQTTATSELAVVSRRVEVEHELQNTWVGSSKRIKLHGTFAVKAGFDLQQNLSVDITPEEILVRLPHAKILGVEQEAVDVLAFENGFWNRISATDVQSELSGLSELAREKAAASELPIQAERLLQEQLETKVHAPQPLRLIFTNEMQSGSNAK